MINIPDLKISSSNCGIFDRRLLDLFNDRPRNENS